MTASNIDEVIEILEGIIQASKQEETSFGYFAALYQKVTIGVQQKLTQDYFDDPQRMEQLDVIFANRYLAAYADYREGKPISASWEKAFSLSNDSGLIVLQHLLLGMNAHINLDLGIAAAEISTEDSIEDLQADFNKINALLSSLVEEVQQDLTKVWPSLRILLKLVHKIDDYLVDFSMNVARNGAWKFANTLVTGGVSEDTQQLILSRDKKVSGITRFICHEKMLLRMVFRVLRMLEKGTPSEKVAALEQRVFF